MSKKSVIGTTSVGVLSSLLAFLGVVSCCGLPVIAGILAWLGIGASQLSFFAEYRPIFIGIAIVSLLFGFWQVYFKKKSSCCSTTSCCGTPAEAEDKPQAKSSIVQQIFLWIGAIVVILMLVLGEQNAPIEQTSNAISPQNELQSESSPGCLYPVKNHPLSLPNTKQVKSSSKAEFLHWLSVPATDRLPNFPMRP